jgi:preprotein translocase subunit SecD
MTTDDPVLDELARANPEPDPGMATSAHDADRLLARIIAEPPAGPGRTRRQRARLLVPVMSVAVVIAVLAVFLRTGGHQRGHAGAGGATTQLVFRVTPAPRSFDSPSLALKLGLSQLRIRLRSAGLSGGQVAASGAHEITVTVPRGLELARLVRILTGGPSLAFYDWEANVVAPDGHTAASELLAQRPAALLLSQGSARGPGEASGAGALPLYAAVQFAARQPAGPAGDLGRVGPEYYMFAAVHHEHCAGPEPCLIAGPAPSRAGLRPGLPTPAGAITVEVPQGVTVLQARGQAVGANSGTPGAGSPRARFYVLRDRVALNQTGITDVHVRKAPVTGYAVSFRFTAGGGRRFQSLTAGIAHRGEAVSLGSTMLEQHVAIAVDGVLQTVPEINFEHYPDGVFASARSADITGGLSRRAAEQLAAEVQETPAPVDLALVHVGG